MNGKEAYDKIFDKLTYDQQQELGEEVLRIVYQDLKKIENLEKVIEILKKAVDEIQFITCDEEDCYGEICLYQKINGSISIPLKTKEEYELLKKVLGNKWYNKPLPAFAPKEEYDYSFVNGRFQKAEKYDCERLEKENQELLVNKNVAQGIATKLKQENNKLKNVIEILVDVLDIKLATSIFADELGDYYLEFKTDTNKRTLRKITKEKYELLKEILSNE